MNLNLKIFLRQIIVILVIIKELIYVYFNIQTKMNLNLKQKNKKVYC